MSDVCIRCGETRAVDQDGYCGHCHWVVRGEIEEGLYRLGQYLKGWLRLEEWCDAHGKVAL